MVTPFRWDQVPRLDADSVRLTNRCVDALRCASAAMEELVTHAQQLGFDRFSARVARVAIHRSVSEVEARIGPGWCALFRTPGTDRVGGLALDDAVASTAILRLVGERPVGELHDWDFGLILWLVLEVQRALVAHGAPVVTFNDERHTRGPFIARLSRGERIVEVVTELCLDDIRGAVRLFLPESMLSEMASSAEAPAIGGAATFVPVSLALTLGKVSLTWGERAALAPGDVVLLDLTAASVRDGERIEGGEVSTGGVGIRARARRRDEAWVFEIAGGAPRASERNWMNTDEETMPLSDAATIDVEAVVGRVTMTLGELAKLTPGHVLVSERGIREPVELVANGTIVGRGELVEVEGRLGVRVVSIGR